MSNAQDHTKKKCSQFRPVAAEPLERLMMPKHTWRGWPSAENSMGPQLSYWTHFLKHRAPTKAILRMQNKYSNKNTQAYGNVKHEEVLPLKESIEIYHTHTQTFHWIWYTIRIKCIHSSRETINYSRLQTSAHLKFSLLFQN
jgi:hypothetical protein